MSDKVVKIIFTLKTNVFDVINIAQRLFQFCIIQLKNKMMIIKKRSIIDVTIIIAMIILKKHHFLIERCCEETHVVNIIIIVLCDDEHESIKDFVKKIILRIKRKRWTILQININECIIFKWWNISYWQLFLNAF